MLRVSGRFEFSIEGSSYRESTVVLFSVHYFEGSRTGVQLGSGLTLAIKNVGKGKIGLKAFFPSQFLRLMNYSGTPLMRLPLGHKILVVITRWSH